MAFCPNCKNEPIAGSAYCNFCGAPLTAPDTTALEQEFLDTTHRLLRWERTAWKISGTVLVILGAFFFVFFSFFGIIGAATAEVFSTVLSAVFFLYAFLFGALFAAIGIVCLVSAKKIPQYLNSMYNDFRPTFDRCDNVGMLILTIFFNEIALIFFLINFVRMKTNRSTINRIIARQQGNI